MKNPGFSAASNTAALPTVFVRVLLAATVCGLVASPGWGQAPADGDDPLAIEDGDCIWVPRSRLSDGPQVRMAFREAVATSRPATVRVRVDGHNVALGGVVGQDGWILTKASCVRNHITCRLSDGRELDARIVGVKRDHDLAMLKVDAKQLPALDLERDAAVQVGHWLATTGLDLDPIAVGIVSVAARSIPHEPAILGVQLDQTDAGPSVVRVFDHTGAAEAGVLVNDILLSIEGNPTPTREQLQREIRRHSPGETIELEVRRGEKRLILPAPLSGQLPGDELGDPTDQNRLGGLLSRRRFGFPAALQHDTVLDPADCGGPVVNLEGKVVGFNIARAGRTESYAIPSSVVVSLLYDLMSGNLSPHGS